MLTAKKVITQKKIQYLDVNPDCSRSVVAEDVVGVGEIVGAGVTVGIGVEIYPEFFTELLPDE